MAILMWPPSNGSQSTMPVNGRIYSASSGNYTSVSYIDVNILESNGWTQTSTDQTAVLIQTPLGIPTERFTVNGRVYVFSPGSTVNVNSFDYPILEAKGFLSTATSASSGAIPVSTSLPAIAGTAQVGQTTWTNAPTSFTYQWKGNGTNIASATASSYVPVTGDVCNTITVSVIATNASGSSVPATSAPTGTVIAAGGAVPINTAVPTVTGTPMVGQTLIAGNGSWTNSPTSFAYQWKRGGANIAGATGSTLVLLVADQGSNVVARTGI